MIESTTKRPISSKQSRGNVEDYERRDERTSGAAGEGTTRCDEKSEGNRTSTRGDLEENVDAQMTLPADKRAHFIVQRQTKAGGALSSNSTV